MPKKRKLKKLYWLLAYLAVMLVVIVLLLYKPSRYDPPKAVYSKQVSPYLTHELSAQLYNGAQLGEPFDLIVIQKGVNDAIARSKWPKDSGGISFSAPAVLFVSDSVVFMGIANIKGLELVVTIVLKPAIDEQGLLNLQVAGVKIGAMNITIPAKLIAKRMYAQKLAVRDIDEKDWGAQIAAALLNNQPFVPVFTVEDKKVRIKKITITDGKVTLRLAPASG